jgi:hypothetical protein
MSYLSSSNSVFGAQSVQTLLNKPVQYNYVQTIETAQFTGYAPIKRSLFQFDAGSTNVVDDLFVADQADSAVIKLPITGIWCVSWTPRFKSTSAENAGWFSVSSKFFNESFGSRRLGYSATTASGVISSITSYFDAGDLLGLTAYSGTANTMGNYYSFLTVTLVQPTAPRANTTLIVPPVTTS